MPLNTTQTDIVARKARRVETRLNDLRETLEYQASVLARGRDIDMGQILRMLAPLADAAAEDHAWTLAYRSGERKAVV